MKQQYLTDQEPKVLVVYLLRWASDGPSMAVLDGKARRATE